MPFLFDKTVFGPVFSRRLGVSLGINLLPESAKYCNFSCIYCECGWTNKLKNFSLPSRQKVFDDLKKVLTEMKAQKKPLHSVTFAGNGEPTVHPDFPEIVSDVIKLRNEYYPEAVISVLSNSTLLRKKGVCTALKKIDKAIMKLDAGDTETFHLINQPLAKMPVDKIVEDLKCFDGKFYMQTLFLRGTYNGKTVDNTREDLVEKWLEKVAVLKPLQVMIYTIARETPVKTLTKIPKEELLKIGEKVKALGIEVLVV